MADEHKSHWDEDEDYPVEDWQYEVANGDTRLGYWDWVKAKKGIAVLKLGPGMRTIQIGEPSSFLVHPFSWPGGRQ